MARVLGIDYGTVRVGLALSDEMELVASPLTTLQNLPGLEEDIARMVRAKQIQRVVVGAPLTMSGKSGPAMARTERFVTLLRRQLPDSVPVELVDERLSSKTAEAALKVQGHDIRAKDGLVDQLAATVILQDYLNSQRGPESYLLPEESYEMPWLDDGQPSSRDKGKRRR
jgi:putative holliday junction resolvase